MNMNHRFGRTLVLLAIVCGLPVRQPSAQPIQLRRRSDVHFTSARSRQSGRGETTGGPGRGARRASGRAGGRKPGGTGRRVDSQADQRRDRVVRLERRRRGRSADLRFRSHNRLRRPVPTIGWRSHRAASDSAIRFANSGDASQTGRARGPSDERARTRPRRVRS